MDYKYGNAGAFPPTPDVKIKKETFPLDFVLEKMDTSVHVFNLPPLHFIFYFISMDKDMIGTSQRLYAPWRSEGRVTFGAKVK